MKNLLLSLLCIVLLNLFPDISFSQELKLNKYREKVQSINSIRIASAAVIPTKWDKEANWNRIEKMVREAAENGAADLVVTPEGILEGYVINEVNAVKDTEAKKDIIEKFKNLAEPLDGIYIKKACKLSDELNIYLLLGFLEQRNSDLFNTVIMIDPDGDIVARYSKTHFAQGYSINPEVYIAGDNFPVFNTPFGKVGIIICYDRQLPEPARIMALKGAQVLFVPSYGGYSDENGWNTVMMRTRAYENKFPLVFCNPYQSLLIDHGGNIKAIGNAGSIVYYEINTDPKRYEGRFKTRRPPVYKDFLLGDDPANK